MKKLKNNDYSDIDSVLSLNFIQYNNNLLLSRIKLIAYLLIMTYPCYFIVDFFLLNGFRIPVYKWVLTIIHFSGFINSILFLLVYKYVKNLNKTFIIHCAVAFFLLSGAAASINSQLFTGNLVAYLVLLIGVSVILPIRPINFFLMMFVIHLIFLISLSFMDKNHFTLLIKQINSTGTAFLALIIDYAFYSFRKQDFINKSKLQQKEKNFRTLFHMNPSPVMLMNVKDNQIVLMNKQAIEYYQFEEKWINTLNGDFLFKSAKEKEEIVNRLHEKQSIENYVSEQVISSNLTRWAMLHFELIHFMDDECLLIGITDVTHLKVSESELLKHATIDILTGVMNRRSGLELLQTQIHNSFSEEFILCFIDINNLKTTNDQLGHSAGDELIKTACDVIKSKMGQNDVIFRLGGDEFIVIFYQKYLSAVQEIWTDIQQEFHRISHSQLKLFDISASHGLYHFIPGTSDTVEEMLEFADKEMYKEKFKLKMNQLNV